MRFSHPLHSELTEYWQAIAQNSKTRLTKHNLKNIPPTIEGSAGVALFLGYANLVAPSLDLEEVIIRCIEHLATNLREGVHSCTLSDGFIGSAWVISHLNGRSFRLASDAFVEIDKQAFERVLHPENLDDYDLLRGLVGIGLYFLNRGDSGYSEKGILGIIDKLTRTSITTNRGVAWLSSSDFLPADLKGKFPNGVFNLGVAHGIPGIIAFLGRVWAAGIHHPNIPELIEGAVSWLLSCQRTDDTQTSFHFFESPSGDNISIPSPRTAWCYGDPGISVALLSASENYHRTDWRSKAIEIGYSAAIRPLTSRDVMLPSFCHGTSGTAHLFNNLFRASNEVVFLEKSTSLFNLTIQHLKNKYSALNYYNQDNCKTPLTDVQADWYNDFSLLNGESGIGLTLLSATTSIQPTWDEIFLASIQPQQPIH